MKAPRISPIMAGLFGVLAQTNVLLTPVLGALLASRAYLGNVKEWGACLVVASISGFLVHFYHLPIVNAVQSLQVSVTVMAAASIAGVIARHFGAVIASYYFGLATLMLLPVASMLPYSTMEYWHQQSMGSRFLNHSNYVLVQPDKLIEFLSTHWLSLWSAMVILSLALAMLWQNRHQLSGWYRTSCSHPLLWLLVMVGVANYIPAAPSYFAAAHPIVIMVLAFPAFAFLHTLAAKSRFKEGILLAAYAILLVTFEWLNAFIISGALGGSYFKNRLEGELCK